MSSAPNVELRPSGTASRSFIIGKAARAVNWDGLATVFSRGEAKAMLRAAPAAFLRWFVASAPVLLPFVASRLFIIGTILLSRTIVRPGPFITHGGLRSVLVQWDGLWYLQIARHSYTFSPTEESSVAFFPLYPLLVDAISSVFRNYVDAAVITSNLCLLGAGFLLHRLVQARFQDARASRFAVTFLMFSPAGLFTTSAYPDALFLLLSLGAFAAAAERRWVLACLCGMGLSATRNVGILIIAPLVVEYLRQLRQGSIPRQERPHTLLFALIPVGLLWFMCFSYFEFGDLFATWRAAAVWGEPFQWPPLHGAVVESYFSFYEWLFLGTLVAALLVWVGGILVGIPSSHSLWAGLLIAAFVCSNPLDAVPRSLGMVFPLFLALGVGAARFRWAYEPMLAATVALLALSTMLAANGFWMR